MSFDLSFAAAAASFAPLAGNWEHAQLAAPFIGDATLAHAAPLAASLAAPWTGAAAWAQSAPLAAQAGLW
ncbi:unnamed protein product [Brachionus calyciflorus]|uniref:Uncharacterized protein n=1 Tax=Brachionus calyciflorus TaxID=104777 RepID=A0A813NL26_9BILA|nr:unnamed protein product [Brachionus calyciflorus]